MIREYEPFTAAAGLPIGLGRECSGVMSRATGKSEKEPQKSERVQSGNRIMHMVDLNNTGTFFRRQEPKTYAWVLLPASPGSYQLRHKTSLCTLPPAKRMV